MFLKVGQIVASVSDGFSPVTHPDSFDALTNANLTQRKIDGGELYSQLIMLYMDENSIFLTYILHQNQDFPNS